MRFAGYENELRFCGSMRDAAIYISMSHFLATRTHRSVRRMNRRSFTLIELVIVVLVIGILAAVAIGVFSGHGEEARINTTMADLQAMRDAVMLYRAETGNYPPDKFPGVFPPELDGYIRPIHFTKEPPVGGRYDWQQGWAGMTAAVGIWQPSVDVSLYQEFDDRFDDGDLNTGSILRKGNTLNLVIE